MTAIKKSPKQASSKVSAPVSVPVVPVNKTRGEIARDVNGKHAVFVPTYANLELVETHFASSIMQILSRIGDGDMRLSTIIPLLVCLNDGDQIDEEEMFLWFSEQSVEAILELLREIVEAIIDPTGRRFTAIGSGETASPN